MTLDVLIKQIIDHKLQLSDSEYFKDSTAEIERVIDMGDGFVYVNMKLNLQNLKTVGAKLVFNLNSFTRRPQLHFVGYKTNLDGLLPAIMIEVLSHYKNFMDDLKNDLMEAYVSIYLSAESSRV